MTTPIFSTRLPKDYHPVMRRLSLRLKTSPELLDDIVALLDRADEGAISAPGNTREADIWRVDLEHKVAGLMEVVAGILKDIQPLKAAQSQILRRHQEQEDETRRLEAIAYQAICDTKGNIEGARELFVTYIMRFPDLRKWVRDMKPAQLASYLMTAGDRWRNAAEE